MVINHRRNADFDCTRPQSRMIPFKFLLESWLGQNLHAKEWNQNFELGGGPLGLIQGFQEHLNWNANSS